MLKVSEYLEHARECEAMAKAATRPEHVRALLMMAATWRELAIARRRQVERWGMLIGDAAALLAKRPVPRAIGDRDQ